MSASMRKALLPAALAAVAWLFLAVSPAAAPEQVELASLEWPPYTGARLAGQGASTEIIRAAFAASGITLNVRFLPWQRAIQEARNAPQCAGYFPAYMSRERAGEWVFSERIGYSPLVFIENAARPVAWNSLDDLAGVPIGTVGGFVNTEEFDRMAAQGRLTVQPVPDDAINIRKVAAGRVALAVIDANVFRYLLANELGLAEFRDTVRINPRPLEDKGLYLCFRRDAQGERLAKAFDAGLARIDSRQMQDDYFARVLQ